MLGAAVHDAVLGSNSSAYARELFEKPIPPATKTFPLLSNVAVWAYLPVTKLPLNAACATVPGPAMTPKAMSVASRRVNPAVQIRRAARVVSDFSYCRRKLPANNRVWGIPRMPGAFWTPDGRSH
jgi:hypothetical protein